MQAMVRKISLAIFIGLLLPSTQIKAAEESSWKMELAKLGAKYAALGAVGTALAVFTALEFRLHSKHPTKNFNSQYNLRECFKLQNILTSRYWRNVWHTIDRGLIGQKSKSSSLKADAGGGIRWSEDVEAHGALGVLHDYEKPIKDTALIIGGVSILGYYALNPDKFIKLFFKKNKKKAAGTTKEKPAPVEVVEVQPHITSSLEDRILQVEEKLSTFQEQRKVDVELKKTIEGFMTTVLPSIQAVAGNGSENHS